MLDREPRSASASSDAVLADLSSSHTNKCWLLDTAVKLPFTRHRDWPRGSARLRRRSHPCLSQGLKRPGSNPNPVLAASSFPALPSREKFTRPLTSRRASGIPSAGRIRGESQFKRGHDGNRRGQHPFAHQGRGDRLGRPPLHRPQGQVAASDHGRGPDRRRPADRRLHVRWLVHRRLEGDQRNAT